VVAPILAVAVEILSTVAVPIWPVHDAAVVAVCDVIGMEVVWRFQGNGDMPDFAGSVAYPEDHIAWSDLRQVFQLTAGVGLVTEDARTDHAGVTTAAVGSIGAV